MQTESDPYKALDGHYQLHFANRPRATRDLPMLTALLAQLPNDQDPRAAAWRREHAAIEAAQTRLTPVGVALAQSMERLALSAVRAHRLLAMAEPAALTRAEIALVFGDCDEALSSAQTLAWPPELKPLLAAEHARVIGSLESAKAALRAAEQGVASVLAEGSADPLWVARAAVTAAQRLFARYRGQVTGRLQPAVRPALLQCLAAGLDEVTALLIGRRPPGVDESTHGANCAQLTEHANAWRKLAEEGSQLRRQRSPSEMVALLLDEADAALRALDEPPTTDAAEEALDWLPIRMDEVLVQLEALPTVFGLGSHEQATLGIVDCVVFLDAREQGQRDGGEAGDHRVPEHPGG